MTRTKIKIPATVLLSLCFVGLTSPWGQAQEGCARCVAPVAGMTRQKLVPIATPATRYQANRVGTGDVPPLTSPYYPEEPAEPVGRFTPVSPRNQLLVPTNSAPAVAPDSRTAPTDEPKAPQKQSPAKLSVTDKISHRYSDPRVLRMLQQLSPQQAESFYLEVSQLIDERHLQPASWARRVDSALDHLSQALDVPAFTSAAQVQGTAAEIASFQESLRRLRTSLQVRNSRDAVLVMRDVQRTATRSFAINPSAISLEFVYGATDSLDQFSMLLPPEKNGGPSVGLREDFVGIGVEIESHPAGLKILKLIPGGPAAQADLRSGDIITHIDGREVKPMEMNRAVELIVGPEGTPVQIQASRGNRSGKVTLTRQKIAVHSVVDVRMQDPAQGVAYLKLEQFSDSTMNEIDAALMSLHRQGMKSLIMDLRGNPGGLLTTAIALSDRFLPSGTIVATRGRTPEDNSRETAHLPNTWKMPLVVLIDHNSASASEIFAAAIQENQRGVIVGEKSYGKGTVQTLFPLQTFPAALRLTTAKFYSPEGREMAGVGVDPDVKVVNGTPETESGDAALNEGLRQILDPRTRALSERFRRSGSVADEYQIAA